MQLRVVRRDVYCVVSAPASGGKADLYEFLEKNYAGGETGAVEGLMSLFDRVAEHGPHDLPDKLSHLISDDPKIFEFIKGRLRVPWFYGQTADGVRLVICTHGFLKQTNKTPAGEKRRARSVYDQYVYALKHGAIEIVTEE